ncbi:type IX secretion system plug protein [Sinomicrobium sp. M5D2P17]
MMHRKKYFLLPLAIMSLTLSGLFAQAEHEVEPPEYIKSIVFKSDGNNSNDQFPVIMSGEAFTLSFDDLRARESDYYYRIVHCNADWTPSDLLKSQFLDGVDNQRIQDYRNSVTTLQPYSHYDLTLPNSRTRLKLSGNYILKIYDNNDKLMFSRRFVIYKDIVSVGVVLKRAREMAVIAEKQVVQLTINTNGQTLVNPQQEVKVVILQNHNWNTAITGIKPQFYSGNQLIYKYDKETSFDGGNEYLYFDNKEIRASSNTISGIELRDIYNTYLFTNTIETDKPYTYYPDINGDFEIRTLDGNDSDNDTEADYADVHFSLKYAQEMGLNEVYVYGKFNNYRLTGQNRMTLDESGERLQVKIRLKQGFYNYKFVMAGPDGIDYTTINGNHFETENNYLVLVYYRNFGDMYDSLIGIGSGTSVNISN